MSCEGSLSFMFPRDAMGSLEEPGSIVVQALPTVTTILFVVAIVSRRRRTSPLLRTSTYVVGSASILALGVLSFRVFDLLACADTGVEGWRAVGVTGLPLSALVILMCATRWPRAATVVALTCAGGTVASDWAVRTVDPTVGQPFASIQHVYDLVALACVTRIHARSARGSVRPVVIAPVAQADPLQRAKARVSWWD